MSNKVIKKVRDGLVIAAAVLMIAIVVFQWMEIEQFELQSVIKERISALFASEPEPSDSAVASEGAPGGAAGAEAPDANALPTFPDGPQSAGN